METKVSQKKMERIRVSCGYNNGIDVDVEGSRGRLSLGWKDNIEVSLQSFSKRIYISTLNMKVRERNGD